MRQIPTLSLIEEKQRIKMLNFQERIGFDQTNSFKGYRFFFDQRNWFKGYHFIFDQRNWFKGYRFIF